MFVSGLMDNEGEKMPDCANAMWEEKKTGPR